MHEAADDERPQRFITPDGFAAIRAEYEQLFGTERPKLVETISWAAGNGDRSENGDYIYGRKRLREIDRRLSYLSKVLKLAAIVDPAAQVDRARVHFGASITVAACAGDGAARRFDIVGEDETDNAAARISWTSPMARALRGARVDDVVTVELPGGTRDYRVLAIDYPARQAG